METQNTPSVLITGASSGIGRATALRMDRAEWRVFAVVRRDEDAQSLAAEASNRLTPIRFDLRDRASIYRAAAEVDAAVSQGGLNGLVNNAGVMAMGPLEFIPLEAVREQFEVNVFGPLEVTQAFLPLLRRAREKNDTARIVQIGSLLSRLSVAFFSPLSASKFALEAFNDALRLELHPSGIDVIMVHPGMVVTPAMDKGRRDAERMLAALPEQGRARYEAAFRQFTATFEREAAQAPAPDKVAEIIQTALLADKPHSHYAVEWRTALAESFVRLAPEGLLDAVRRKVQGLE